MAKQKITFKNYHLGAISDSDYFGTDNSMAMIWGFDVHSEVGVAKVNQALTKDSGTTVDDFVRTGVSCSDGNTYFFGSTNGKIWKRTGAGTWTLEATASPATGTAGILEAKEYQGYIYYAMSDKLGRWQLGTAWSTRNDNWDYFENGEILWHPMRIVNEVLYVGDRHMVAQVDAGVFSRIALDLTAPLKVKCLGQLGTDLLIGTYVASNVVETQIFRWNTWSVSFTNSDPIPEVGINSFLAIDNGVLVNAGTKGNLYIYNGSTLEPQKQIKGSWDNSTNKAQINPNANLNFHGLPIFGLSTISGTPTNMGIYSFGRANRNYPMVLNGEHGISTGNLNNIEIGAIIGYGDIYFVTWKDGVTYGVDKLDLALKYSGAYMTTRNIMVDRMTSLNYGVINIAHRLLPAGTLFNVYKKVNHASSFTQITDTQVNDLNKIFTTEVDINNANILQVKIAPTVSGNTAPEMESFDVMLNT
jgi:hypothetical protein